MSKLTDLAKRENARHDRQDAAIEGLVADIQFLNDTIVKLQNSPGEFTPEDQADMDLMETRTQAVVDKLEALAAKTPATPPPTPA